MCYIAHVVRSYMPFMQLCSIVVSTGARRFARCCVCNTIAESGRLGHSCLSKARLAVEGRAARSYAPFMPMCSIVWRFSRVVLCLLDAVDVSSSPSSELVVAPASRV